MNEETQEIEQTENIELAEVASEETEATEEISVEPEEKDARESIADFAKAIEVEPEYLYGLKVGMGEGVESVTLGDLKDKYQLNSHELDTLRKQAADQEENIKKLNQGATFGTESSQAAMFANMQQQQLIQQYNNVDWASLDDQEARNLKQDFSEAAQNFENQATQAAQQEKKFHQQQMGEANKRLVELLPQWVSTDVRKRDQEKIGQAMLEAGYGADVVNNMSDPIAVSLMHELVTLREEKKAATSAVQKVRSAPKVLKRGGKAEPASAKSDDLIAKAQRTGKRSDQMAAMRSIMGKT